MKTIFVWLLMTQVAAAACVTVDTSAFTPITLSDGSVITVQTQINNRIRAAYDLYSSAGENIVPTIAGDDICFAGSTLDVATIITPTTMRDFIEQKAEENIVITDDNQQATQDLEDEIAANNLCGSGTTLVELNDRIDAGVDGITNLASAKAFMRGAFKKVARCLKARVELRQ